MATTTNFALRTFAEFKDAAKSLVGLYLYEPHAHGGGAVYSAVQTDSINSVFNSLISKGILEVAKILDAELAKQTAALSIAQEVMRFLLGNPAAQRAYAVNFDEGSAARRVIEACDAGNREAEENNGAIADAGRGLSDVESLLFDLVMWSNNQGDGISQSTGAEVLATVQNRVFQLSAAKGAIQRATLTQGEAGTRTPH